MEVMTRTCKERRCILASESRIVSQFSFHSSTRPAKSYQGGKLLVGWMTPVTPVEARAGFNFHPASAPLEPASDTAQAFLRFLVHIGI